MTFKNALLLGGAVACFGSTAAFAQDATSPAAAAQTQPAPVAPEPAAPAVAAPAPAAEPAAGPAAQAAPDEGTTAEIVVTARRREEALSKVPISVSAFSQDTLSNKSITSIEQLTQITPGLVFGHSGGSGNPQVVIRGQSRANIGDAAQPVLTYFADVPLPYVSSIIPAYDLASVQVLKGPQGTLFGRNSTSGAVLVYPAAPTYKLGGYAMAGYGNYNNIQVEGAVNVPIIDDHIALRISGQRIKRDGYTQSVTSGQKFDDQNDSAFRASLLLEFGDFHNTTVYDYVKWHRNGDGAVFTHIYPGTIAPRLFPASFFDCGTSPTCDIDLALAKQQTLGPRQNQSSSGLLNTEVAGLSNTSTYDLGSLTLKNIFGYRTAYQYNVVDTDGTAMGLTTAENLQDFRQLSDEFQVQGSFFDDRLDTIVGAFYLKSEPSGENGLIVAPFTPVLQASLIQSYRTQTSKALFGQATYDFGGGFKVDVGARHTWDKTEACALGYGANQPYTPGTPVATLDQCRNGGTLVINGRPVAVKGTQIGDSSAAWTWNGGLDYQVTNNVFTYATIRRGYRSGGVNTPILAGNLVPFQSYKPETVTDVEIGLKTKWSAGGLHGTLNIDFFRGTYIGTQRGVNGLGNNFDGDGNASTDPSAGTIIINAGKSRVKGFDIDGSVVPTHGLTLSAFVSYNNEKYLDTGTPAVLAAAHAFPSDPADTAFPYAPELTFGGSAEYERSLGPDVGMLAFNADVYRSSVTYFSPFKSDTSLEQPAYATVNARVDLRDVGGSPVSLGVYVKNLTNKLYSVGAANSATASGFSSLFYAAPRLYGVEARVKF